MPDPNAHETVEAHVALLLDALTEARDSGRFRAALRGIHAWELRLIVIELMMPAAAPIDGGVEHRAAGILNFDANLAMLRGYVDGNDA